MNKIKKGFSLLELSIIIIIIAILAVSAMQGSDLIHTAKIVSAARTTKSSIISKIDGLAIWYETTMPKSLYTNQAIEGESVSFWADISGVSLTPNNATQNVINNQPTYITDAINGLPVLRFNGTNNYLEFDGSLLVNSNYTIFIVARKGIDKPNNMILGGTNITDNNKNLQIGYDNTPFIVKHYGETGYINYTPPLYANPTFQIHSVIFDSNVGKAYYENGTKKTTATDKTSLASWTGSAIGRFTTNYFNGDIAEIIMFNRVLSDQEREDVEQYLSDKYQITIP